MNTSVDDLVVDIRGCRVCVDHPIGQPLPHAPRPVIVPSTMARLCIAGQAPGTRVHQSGRPFTDPSGDRLRAWMGVNSDIFYDANKLAIVPMGFCFPGLDAKGGDLPPRKECRHTWHDRIFAAMPQLELVLVIGQYAQAYHLGSKKRKTLTDTVSAWEEIYDQSSSPKVLPLPHPSWRNNAWIKKNPWFERDLLPFLKAEVKQLVQ